jgi:hypothetical protein
VSVQLGPLQVSSQPQSGRKVDDGILNRALLSLLLSPPIPCLSWSMSKSGQNFHYFWPKALQWKRTV